MHSCARTLIERSQAKFAHSSVGLNLCSLQSFESLSLYYRSCKSQCQMQGEACWKVEKVSDRFHISPAFKSDALHQSRLQASSMISVRVGNNHQAKQKRTPQIASKLDWFKRDSDRAAWRQLIALICT